MKLHSAVQDQAILSNVGQVGEFRIRNSAKAFNILSSGLYANKIRAVVRELSCNAVDSHVAAGRADTPFEVHLPNALESYFSIRDYGTGLSHEQVTSIYTTYFESTKTDSNAFIGALGLGSKSPFSYTDNFTVTAIKDGRKGIYTAFINEQGVPSIALMMEEATTDSNGVEVRFAVDSRYDFDKFRQEARYVYEYFKLRPVISGNADFGFKDPEYKEKDIIPGVHHGSDGYRSYAIMGNIKYPIEVPNDGQALGDLHRLLGCGLVMEFDIGELDFQASREGLSYIPQTIDAIKRKLEQLNNQLTIHIAKEADKIDNLWDRAVYLNKRNDDPLWNNAVQKYAVDTKFELFNAGTHRWNSLKQFELDVQELASQYNIVIRAFSKNRGVATCTGLKTHVSHVQSVAKHSWQIRVSDEAYFVINDTKVGALERAKFHWRNSKMESHSNHVFVIEAVDKNKPVDTKAFFDAICNPPAKRIMKASDLLEKARSNSMGKNVTIMSLSESSRGHWRNREMVWRDAGKADNFDSKQTYYYIPLKGYQALNRFTDVKSLHVHLERSGVFSGTIYGVRKSDIDYIKTQKNWVELDKLIVTHLDKLDKENVMGLVKQQLDIEDLIKYNSGYINSNSPFLKLVNLFKDVKAVDSTKQNAIQILCKHYNVATKTNPEALIAQYTKEVSDIQSRYPLLKNLGWNVDKSHVAEYINLIDQTKGV